jgi:hypothetical protein
VTRPFTPRLDVLPAPQRRLWGELSAIPPEFVLYGGTAVALHLGHRVSVDFDFFRLGRFDPFRLMDDIPLLDRAEIVQTDEGTLSVVIDRDGPVKLSFFGLNRFVRLEPPLTAPDTGMKIASLLDLAGTKASVVQVRAEAKDYIDLDALMTVGGIGLPMALAAAAAIYHPRFNPQITVKALSFFDDGNLAAVPDVVRARLVAAVRAVNLDQLPAVQLGSRTP